MTHIDIVTGISELVSRERNVNAVIVEHRDDVALLRLNQPQTMNALSPAIKQGLETVVPKLMADNAYVLQSRYRYASRNEIEFRAGMEFREPEIRQRGLC